eukprot:15458985-Alexandrium_andersonii.AAC.1
MRVTKRSTSGSKGLAGILAYPTMNTPSPRPAAQTLPRPTVVSWRSPPSSPAPRAPKVPRPASGRLQPILRQ